jgi:hypothetical protein
MRPDSVMHEGFPSPDASEPLRRTYGGVVENVHNYKSGGTSFHIYLQCEYGQTGERRSEGGTFPSPATVFVVREPISRFIAGVREILVRFASDTCPLGERCGNLDHESALRHTAWYPLVANASAQLPDGPGPRPPNQFAPSLRALTSPSLNLTRLLEAFIDDATCCRTARRPAMTDGLDYLLSQVKPRHRDLQSHTSTPNLSSPPLGRASSAATAHICSDGMS